MSNIPLKYDMLGLKAPSIKDYVQIRWELDSLIIKAAKVIQPVLETSGNVHLPQTYSALLDITNDRIRKYDWL